MASRARGHARARQPWRRIARNGRSAFRRSPAAAYPTIRFPEFSSNRFSGGAGPGNPLSGFCGNRFSGSGAAGGGGRRAAQAGAAGLPGCRYRAAFPPLSVLRALTLQRPLALSAIGTLSPVGTFIGTGFYTHRHSTTDLLDRRPRSKCFPERKLKETLATGPAICHSSVVPNGGLHERTRQ
jgi:hypothetical protein